jgi:hypothetical protein
VTYPCEWMASTDPTDETGTATFTIEGKRYALRLESFDDFQKVTTMLDACFKQGKVFAAASMRDHVQRSLDAAERVHDLA